MSESVDDRKRLAISVVVPTRDRPSALERCLASLSLLDYPRDRFEVIVVDDGSVASPESVVESSGRKLAVRLIARAHAGPAAARNTGAAAAKHPFLAFIDDDCTADPGWLSALAARLQATPEAMVGGQVVNALPDNRYSEASQELIAYLYDYFNEHEPRFLCSNNLAVPLDGFLSLGGFDRDFGFAAGEDRELCDRWRFAGHPIRFAANAVVRHYHDLDLRGFWQQHVRYGRAAAHYRELFARRRGKGVTMEPAAFYLKLLSSPFRAGPSASAFTRAGLLAVSQIANAGGYLYEQWRRRRELEAAPGDVEP